MKTKDLSFSPSSSSDRFNNANNEGNNAESSEEKCAQRLIMR